MALKSTSSPITISTRIEQGVANAFQVQPVDLQLNPLDQEVFVVTGLKIDFDNIPQPDPALFAPSAVLQAEFVVSVCKNRPATMQTISDSNCVGSADVTTLTGFDATPSPVGLAVHENNPMDNPPSQLDYIDIIATDNFFLAVDGANASGVCNADIRMFGYRARADAATYSALVQSEMLSQ